VEKYLIWRRKRRRRDASIPRQGRRQAALGNQQGQRRDSPRQVASRLSEVQAEDGREQVSANDLSSSPASEGLAQQHRREPDEGGRRRSPGQQQKDQKERESTFKNATDNQHTRGSVARTRMERHGERREPPEDHPPIASARCWRAAARSTRRPPMPAPKNPGQDPAEMTPQ